MLLVCSALIFRLPWRLRFGRGGGAETTSLPVSQHILLSTHLAPTYLPQSGTSGKSVQKSWKLNPLLPSTLASGRDVEKASAGWEKGQEPETQVLEPIL